VLLATSLLGACASSNNRVANSLQTWDAAVSTTTELSTQLRSPQTVTIPLDQIAFQLATIDSVNNLKINTNSPIVSFPEGNSFVGGLFLPKHISRFTFALESDAGRTVFVPSVIFLNDNLQVLSRIDDVQFNSKGYFSFEKEFNADSAQGIRYIVVYSKDSELDGKSELIDIAREYELMKGKELPELSYPKLYSKHSPIGNVSVNLSEVYFNTQAINNELQVKQTTTAVSKSADMPTILADTEAFYLEQISNAIKADNGKRAMSLVEEAERAGSTKARAHYDSVLNAQQ